jgi:hypothetical protein
MVEIFCALGRRGKSPRNRTSLCLNDLGGKFMLTDETNILSRTMKCRFTGRDGHFIAHH